LQIIELPEQGLDTLMVVDLNLNENELGYLGDSLAKAPRLKVTRIGMVYCQNDLDKGFVYIYLIYDQHVTGF
jgi:hypothetical protein